ncbi:MAG TPA: hypothetical protein PKW90_01095 [Myxococcota bacterium]|nr:hypothetical protein [Myxococcota bacterium]
MSLPVMSARTHRMNHFGAAARETEGEEVLLAATFYTVASWHEESCEDDPRCANLGCGKGSTQAKATKRAHENLTAKGVPDGAMPNITELGQNRTQLYNTCVNQDRGDIIGGLPF